MLILKVTLQCQVKYLKALKTVQLVSPTLRSKVTGHIFICRCYRSSTRLLLRKQPL